VLRTLPTSSYTSLMCASRCSSRCSSSSLQPSRSSVQSSMLSESFARALAHSLPAYKLYCLPAEQLGQQQQRQLAIAGAALVGSSKRKLRLTQQMLKRLIAHASVPARRRAATDSEVLSLLCSAHLAHTGRCSC
jgi:hypothetical protein